MSDDWVPEWERPLGERVRFDTDAPPAPPGSGDAGIVEGADEDEIRVSTFERVASRDRLVPQVSPLLFTLLARFIPRPLRARTRLHPEVVRRLGLIWEMVRWLFVLAIAGVSIAVLGSWLLHINDTEPRTYQQLIAVISAPSEDVAWSVETVRLNDVDGEVIRLDSLRGLAVDLRHGQFQAQVDGLADSQVRAAGDGQAAVVQVGEGGVGYFGCQADACPPKSPGAPPRRGYPSLNDLRPVLPSDLARDQGSILDAQDTVQGQQAWLFRWHPSSADLERMLSVDLLADMGLTPEQDAAPIAAKAYKVQWATGTVIRSSHRLYQIEVQLQMNAGAEFRILVTYNAQDTGQESQINLSSGDAASSLPATTG